MPWRSRNETMIMLPGNPEIDAWDGRRTEVQISVRICRCVRADPEMYSWLAAVQSRGQSIIAAPGHDAPSPAA